TAPVARTSPTGQTECGAPRAWWPTPGGAEPKDRRHRVISIIVGARSRRSRCYKALRRIERKLHSSSACGNAVAACAGIALVVLAASPFIAGACDCEACGGTPGAGVAAGFSPATALGRCRAFGVAWTGAGEAPGRTTTRVPSRTLP